MRVGPALVCLLALLLAGCTGEPDQLPPPADEAPPGDRDAATDAGTGPAPEAASDALPAPVEVTGRHDGRLEYGTRVCQPSTGGCTTIRPVPGDHEFFIDIPSGTLVAGNATLTWQPASPFTQEMRLTVFWRPACAECDLVFLGGTIAPGPIHADFEVPVAVDGGQVWAYARAPYANQAGDVYVQTDFEQDFTIEVAATVQPAAAV